MISALIDRRVRGCTVVHAFLGAFLFTALSSVAQSVQIAGEATNIGDVTPGQDLWRYSYRVTGRSFAANEGFTIFFDKDIYRDLENPPPLVNTNWDAISVQRDLALDADGFYDALAKVDGPSLAEPFTVSFVWLGQGTPGVQPFGVYDSTFATIATGQTFIVPELSGGSLVLVALFTLQLLRPQQNARAVARHDQNQSTRLP